MPEEKGGMSAHWTRRLIHVGMACVPVLYHLWGYLIASWFGVHRATLMLIIVGLIIVGECVRLTQGVVLFGQREYERHQVSAVAWGGLALGLVCVFSPGFAISLPIVWTCSVVDPVMGEMRRYKQRPCVVALAGLLLAYLVWMGAWWYLGTPLVFALLCPTLAVLAEYPRLRWIDDNALMMLVPLMCVLLLSGVL